MEEDRPESVVCMFQNNVNRMIKSNKEHANFVTWTSSTRNPVKFLNENVLHAMFHFKDPKNGNPILTHLCKLLDSQLFSDVTFVVQGREITAHLAVVSRSAVMSAMFKEGAFKEGQSRTVVIDDVDGDIFNELLRYLYTDKEPELESEPKAEKLLTAAEKYQIDGLKAACQRKLASQVNLKNAIRFLVVGYLHSTPQLVDLSLKCLADNRNNVWSLPEWKELMKNYPNLFIMASERMAF